jgi:hypothetical protein
MMVVIHLNTINIKMKAKCQGTRKHEKTEPGSSINGYILNENSGLGYPSLVPNQLNYRWFEIITRISAQHNHLVPFDTCVNLNLKSTNHDHARIGEKIIQAGSPIYPFHFATTSKPPKQTTQV